MGTRIDINAMLHPNDDRYRPIRRSMAAMGRFSPLASCREADIVRCMEWMTRRSVARLLEVAAAGAVLVAGPADARSYVTVHATTPTPSECRLGSWSAFERARKGSVRAKACLVGRLLVDRGQVRLFPLDDPDVPNGDDLVVQVQRWGVPIPRVLARLSGQHVALRGTFDFDPACFDRSQWPRVTAICSPNVVRLRGGSMWAQARPAS